MYKTPRTTPAGREKKTFTIPARQDGRFPEHTLHSKNSLGSEYLFIEDLDKTRKGYDFTGKLGDAASIWYPFNGFYSYIDGKLYDGGNTINVWSSDIPENPDYCVEGLVINALRNSGSLLFL